MIIAFSHWILNLIHSNDLTCTYTSQVYNNFFFIHRSTEYDRSTQHDIHRSTPHGQCSETDVIVRKLGFNTTE